MNIFKWYWELMLKGMKIGSDAGFKSAMFLKQFNFVAFIDLIASIISIIILTKLLFMMHDTNIEGAQQALYILLYLHVFTLLSSHSWRNIKELSGKERQ